MCWPEPGNCGTNMAMIGSYKFDNPLPPLRGGGYSARKPTGHVYGGIGAFIKQGVHSH